MKRHAGTGLIVGIVALEVCLALGYYALATVLPQVADALEATGSFSVAAAGPLITSVFGLAVASGWADRVGPRTPLAWGFTGLAVGESLCALAPTMTVFIAGRLLLGLGIGLVGVALYGLIGYLIAPERRPAVFGWLNASWLVPSLVGPAIAGFVADHIGWRAVFGAVAILILASYGVLWWNLRRHQITVEPSDPAPTPWLWASLAAAAMFALHVGGQSPTAWGVAASAVGLVAAWFTMRALLPVGTLRAQPGVPRLIALRALLATTLATEVYVPYYLQHERGVSLTVSGLVLAASAVGWAVGAWAQAPWSRRRSTTEVLRVSAILAPVGPGIALAVVTTGAPVWVLAVGLVAMGLGLGAAYPQISTAALAMSPQRQQASVGGALQLGEAASGGAILAVTGLLLAFAGAFALTEVFAALLVVGLIGTAVAFMAEPTTR